MKVTTVTLDIRGLLNRGHVMLGYNFCMIHNCRERCALHCALNTGTFLLVNNYSNVINFKILMDPPVSISQFAIAAQCGKVKVDIPRCNGPQPPIVLIRERCTLASWSWHLVPNLSCLNYPESDKG
jgi:hypothetical protein